LPIFAPEVPFRFLADSFAPFTSRACGQLLAHLQNRQGLRFDPPR
jgi:hypothetical protein